MKSDSLDPRQQHTVALRIRLLDIVGSIGPTLPETERFALLCQLNFACARDRDETVMRAFLMAAGGLGLGGLLSHLANVPTVIEGA